MVRYHLMNIYIYPHSSHQVTGDSNSVGAAEAEDAKSRSRAVAKR